MLVLNTCELFVLTSIQFLDTYTKISQFLDFKALKLSKIH